MKKTIEEKMDMALALLKIIARNNFRTMKEEVLSTDKKEAIFGLCTGKYDMTEIAKKVSVSAEYVRLTLQELERYNLIIIKKDGKKFFPEKVI